MALTQHGTNAILVSRLRLGSAALALMFAPLAPLASDAQAVRLEIRPRVGDTIQMRLDQEMEMSGTSRAAAGPARREMRATMHARTRAIPLRSSGSVTTVLAITDSVAISPGGGDLPALRKARLALQGRRVELRVQTNGAIDVVNTGEHDGDNPLAFGPMPAMLPTTPVSIGSSWSRDLSIPIVNAGQGAVTVRATFRLDSLGRNGDIAYLSMRGMLTRLASSGGASGSQQSTGSLQGTMQLDRRLGWVTDTRLTLSVTTVITPADAGRPPTNVQMRVTQRLRAVRGP